MCNEFYQAVQVLPQEDQTLTWSQRMRLVISPLMHWYAHHQRILPWRASSDPYLVWISEIMLQQTRVEAVKPYFARFTKALPTVSALAAVPEDKLLKLWEGLGYYSRARNLKKAATIIMEQYGGVIPSDYGQLLALPGIGSYTAGAIASISFGLAVPAVDGNVLRVLSRFLGSYEDITLASAKKTMEKLVLENMDKSAPGDYNQALIELGAIVCIPKGIPLCGQCPLASLCVARQAHLIDELPVKTPKKGRRTEAKTVFIIRNKDHVAIRKREDQGLLASLYEFPNVSGHLAIETRAKAAQAAGLDCGRIVSVKPLEKARHIFSHLEWDMIGYEICLDGEIPECYFAVEFWQIREEYPIPNAFRVYKNAFLKP